MGGKNLVVSQGGIRRGESEKRKRLPSGEGRKGPKEETDNNLRMPQKPGKEKKEEGLVVSIEKKKNGTLLKIAEERRIRMGK